MDTVHPATYTRWRSTTLGRITERVERDLVLELVGPLAGKRLLDVGCGDGTYAIAAAERGASVTGVDLAAPMLEAARRRAAERHVDIRFERADLRALPFDIAERGSFDLDRERSIIQCNTQCF